MRHEEKEIRNVQQLITMLDAHSSGEVLWYRGHGDSEWRLTPSICRAYPTNPVQTEWALLKRFRQNAPRLITETMSEEWDWLFLMQHYGVETRLLDWSESPLSALYFAVEDEAKDDIDGALYILDPGCMNRELGQTSGLQNDFPFCGLDELLDGYLTSRVLASVEAPQNPIAAMAPRNSARIAAQLGVFVIFHADFSPMEDKADGTHYWRYVIPKDAKSSLRKELAVLQINKFSLFPELTNAGALAKERLYG